MRPAGRPPRYYSIEAVITPGETRDTEQNANSEPRTFVQVLRAQQSMVFSIAYQFLRNREAAEEVAQDVFVQLHQHFDELKSDAHISFWLRKVASHRSIDYVRKRRFEAGVGLEDAPVAATGGEQQDYFLKRRLQSLVGSLPEKPRMVMILRYQEDMMPEEIASVLNMPVRTVKSHLQRSLAMLREKIDRSMGDVR